MENVWVPAFSAWRSPTKSDLRDRFAPLRRKGPQAFRSLVFSIRRAFDRGEGNLAKSFIGLGCGAKGCQKILGGRREASRGLENNADLAQQARGNDLGEIELGHASIIRSRSGQNSHAQTGTRHPEGRRHVIGFIDDLSFQLFFDQGALKQVAHAAVSAGQKGYWVQSLSKIYGFFAASG